MMENVELAYTVFQYFSNPGLVLYCVYLKYSGKQSIRMLDVTVML